jgi:GntR family transcriptional regulator, transcriptional repressor for pyruvate dehydrogenase complex
VRRGVNGAPDGVVRRSLPEQVATLLHEQIANGTYTGGSKLPHQRDLAASFGVSIAVAREALALLASGGLVRARSGQGTFVTDQPEAALRFPAWVAAPMGAEELTEAIEARDVIEHATAIRAAHRRTDEDVERLREIVGAMADAGDDAAAFISADLALHLEIAAAARNRPLAGALAALHRALRDTVEIGVRTAIEEDWLPRLVECHQELVEAVAAQDLGGAGAAMDRMLDRLRLIATDRGLVVSERLTIWRPE